MPASISCSGHQGGVAGNLDDEEEDMKKKNRCIDCNDSFCDPCRIQTCNLLIRSQMLYSVELTDR